MSQLAHERMLLTVKELAKRKANKEKQIDSYLFDNRANVVACRNRRLYGKKARGY